MTEISTRLRVLSEMLKCIAHLSYWKYTSDFELLETTCEETDLLLRVFQSNGYREQIVAHFKESDMPILLSDSLGFVILAAAEKQEGLLRRYYLLGPCFATESMERNLEAKMDALSLSASHHRQVLQQLQAIPVIDYDSFQRYGVMLHYCLTGQDLSRTEICLEHPADPENLEDLERWQKKEYHGTWHMEQTMMQLIREGNMNYDKLIDREKAHGNVGALSTGDPLRQAKNTIIVQTTLSTRAAIQGGVSPETAYSVSDHYIQMIEDCKTVSAVYALAYEMVHDFIRRVHRLKTQPAYSSLTLACMDYIGLHVFEKITIGEIAKHLGYADYYLSTSFKKDTGENIRDYISRQKVEQAQLLLRSTDLDIQNIAEQLSFANASYFSAVFRKFSGMTPGEYRDTRG